MEREMVGRAPSLYTSRITSSRMERPLSKVHHPLMLQLLFSYFPRPQQTKGKKSSQKMKYHTSFQLPHTRLKFGASRALYLDSITTISIPLWPQRAHSSKVKWRWSALRLCYPTINTSPRLLLKLFRIVTRPIPPFPLRIIATNSL